MWGRSAIWVECMAEVKGKRGVWVGASAGGCRQWLGWAWAVGCMCAQTMHLWCAYVPAGPPDTGSAAEMHTSQEKQVHIIYRRLVRLECSGVVVGAVMLSVAVVAMLYAVGGKKLLIRLQVVK